MNTVIDLFARTLLQVWTSFTHNWPFLLLSIVIAVLLKLYLDPQKVSAFLLRHQRAGVLGATAAAVGTPLCSCGTTAVVLGMLASTLPWAPIVAFMVASPLTSPEELVYSAGLYGWPFAAAFFISSILLGLGGGLAAAFFEKRGWLKNQVRQAWTPAAQNQAGPQPAENRSAAPARPAAAYALVPAAASAAAAPAGSCGCDAPALVSAPTLVPAAAAAAAAPAGSCACDTPAGAQAESAPERVTLGRFGKELLATARSLLPMFLGFAFIGYLLNGLIPESWVTTLFGAGSVYSVPLAATLGLPLYINSEASLPLVRALLDGGMSQGAALAFLITGAGTSLGALMGALTIARWRVIALVVGTLWVGAIAAGAGYNLLVSVGLV